MDRTSRPQPVVCDVASGTCTCASLALCKDAGGNVDSTQCSHAVLIIA
jgi:hypothetical protein